MVLTTICVTSCATKTVVVNSDADVVRIGKAVVGEAYVWSAEKKQWESVKKFTYPKGWYAGPFHPKN